MRVAARAAPLGTFFSLLIRTGTKIPSMPFFRGPWTGYLTTGIFAFTSGITIYLIISDSARRSEIHRRKALVSTDQELSVLEKAQRRFGVLRVGGRFVNPFEELYPFWRKVLTVDGGSRELGNGLCGRF